MALAVVMILLAFLGVQGPVTPFPLEDPQRFLVQPPTVAAIKEELGLPQGIDSNAIDAARATMMALRASLIPKMSMKQDVILKSGKDATVASSDENAAIALARVAKPTLCGALVEQGQLLVNCQELTGDQLRSHEVELVEYLSGLRELDEYPKNQTDLILLRSGNEKLTISTGAFERWCLDYMLPLGVAVTGRRPRKEDLQNGVKYEFVISRPERVGQQGR